VPATLTAAAAFDVAEQLMVREVAEHARPTRCWSLRGRWRSIACRLSRETTATESSVPISPSLTRHADTQAMLPRG
jgi:hypothetical protein